MSKLSILVKVGDAVFIWDFTAANSIISEYVAERKKEGKATKMKVYEDLSKACFVDVEAVRNWFRGKNGPSDMDKVVAIADYFGRDKFDFLQPSTETRMDAFMEEVLGEMNMMGNRVDYRTILFIEMLNDFAEASKNGFWPFSQYTEYVEPWKRGIIFIDEPGKDYGKVVMDLCVDECHHDVVDTYDESIWAPTYRIRVMEYEDCEDDDDDRYYLLVTDDYDDMYITVSNGRWHS
jgi:hypothetical protein